MNNSSEDSQCAQWLMGCYSGKAELVAGSPGQSMLNIDKWPPKGRLPHSLMVRSYLLRV